MVSVAVPRIWVPLVSLVLEACQVWVTGENDTYEATCSGW